MSPCHNLEPSLVARDSSLLLSVKSNQWTHLSPFYTRMHGEWLRYAKSTSQFHWRFLLSQRWSGLPSKSPMSSRHIVHLYHCQVKSIHLYLYSAFNNTNCNKALHNTKIGKFCQCKMTGFNTQLSAECISLLNLVMALSSLVQFK